MKWLLTPLSLLYSFLIRARNLYYDRVRSAVRRAGVPVISVGNLTVGGTGKTPMVIEVVRQLRALGRRPAILTRGYAAGAGETADEVLEFRDALPDVPVVVNADRVAGAETAQRVHGADCLVLDDGFQHRRLARDLDIVLIDALDPDGGGWLLPAGRLREPRGSLRRADVLVVTRANQVELPAVAAVTNAAARRAGGKPVLLANVVADVVVGRDGRRLPPSALLGRRIAALCGIGNPQTFGRLLESLVDQSFPLTAVPDHYRYRPADGERYAARARSAGAEWVVTTRKDWVKLAPMWPAQGPELVRLDVRLELTAGPAELAAHLRRAVENQP